MAITKEHQEFIERVGALAAADMKKSGVLASLTIAPAATCRGIAGITAITRTPAEPQ